MIGAVDIEMYFQNNKDNLNWEKCISVFAWKSGSLIDCRGEEQTFTQDVDEIIREGQYDYSVKRFGEKTVINFEPEFVDGAKKIGHRSLKEIVHKKIIDR